MGINNLSQLPPDLQAAAASVQPGSDGPRLPIPDSVQTSGQDNLAAPNTPTGLASPAPAPGSMGDKLQASLANPTNGTPLTFNDKLKAGTNAAAAATPPAQRAAPGAWARSLIAGAQHALGSVEDSLGDAATAAAEGPNYGGIAGAVGRIHNAETARKQQAQVAQSQQQKDAALIASTNVQTMYHQTMLHQLSDELNEKDIQQGQAKLKSMTTDLAGHHLQPGAVIAQDITESQLTKAINDKTWDPTKETYMATGSFEVPGQKDAQGQPLKQKTYTIVGIPQEQVLNKDQVDKINKYVAGVHFDYNADKPDAVKIPGAQALNLLTAADAGQISEDHRDQELQDAKLKKLDTDQKIAADEAGQRLTKNVDYIKANSQAKGNLQGVYDYLAKSDPQSASDMVTYYGGPKNFSALVDKQAEDAEKKRADDERVRHDQRIEEENAQKETDKRNADLSNHVDAFGNKSNLDTKEFNKRYDQFSSSTQAKTLQNLSGSYEQFQNVLGEIDKGNALSAPEALAGLFAAIGISATPLAGKGFRINNNVIQEHVQGRGAVQGAVAKLQGLTTGAVVTPDQMQKYAKVALEVYQNAYIDAAKEQLRVLGYTDILPRGENTPIDPVTAKMYATMAGGDPNKAAAAAQTQGWQASPENFGGQRQQQNGQQTQPGGAPAAPASPTAPLQPNAAPIPQDGTGFFGALGGKVRGNQ